MRRDGLSQCRAAGGVTGSHSSEEYEVEGRGHGHGLVEGFDHACVNVTIIQEASRDWDIVGTCRPVFCCVFHAHTQEISQPGSAPLAQVCMIWRENLGC